MQENQNNRKTKILFVVGTLGPGGIERLVALMSVFFKRSEKYEVEICCLIDNDGFYREFLDNNDIKTYVCNIHDRKIKVISRLRKIIEKSGAKIVHSHVVFSIPWQLLAIKLAGIRKIIFTQHNDYQGWEKSEITRIRYKIILNLSYPFISYYTGVSRKIVNKVKKLLPLNKFKIKEIPNGIDVEKFRYSDDKRKLARQIFDVSSDDYVIGNVARFDIQKGHYYLLRAFAQVLNDNKAVKLVLIGDGELREKLIIECKNLNIEKHTLFLGIRTDVHILLAGLDCYVLPSSWEGMPLNLLEAMSMGLPTISTRISGTMEIIDDEVDGFLVEPKSPNQIARKIAYCIENRHDSEAMGNRARLKIERTYSIDKMIKQYITLYEG